MYRILLTCPPMINRLKYYEDKALSLGLEIITPNSIVQTLSEQELIELLPEFDGWIIGDDPATRRVLKAGKEGKLKVCIKWGVGVDNVDFNACRELGIPVENTPGMFGEEVADIAVGYMINLARNLVQIDREVRKGIWYKPCGNSIKGKTVALLGFGDIGQKIALRLTGFRVNLFVCDPGFCMENGKIKCLYNQSLIIDQKDILEQFIKEFNSLESIIAHADYLIICCNLNNSTYHIVNKEILDKAKDGLSIINVSRGPVVEESAVLEKLDENKIKSLAFDVYEWEPLPKDSKLRDEKYCGRTIFGTHNASNTEEAVDRTSLLVIQKINSLLNGL